MSKSTATRHERPIDTATAPPRVLVFEARWPRPCARCGLTLHAGEFFSRPDHRGAAEGAVCRHCWRITNLRSAPPAVPDGR